MINQFVFIGSHVAIQVNPTFFGVQNVISAECHNGFITHQNHVTKITSNITAHNFLLENL